MKRCDECGERMEDWEYTCSECGAEYEPPPFWWIVIVGGAIGLWFYGAVNHWWPLLPWQ